MQPIHRVGSIGDLLTLDPTKPVMVDTETEQFYSEIRLIQVFQEGMEQALLYDVKEARPGVEVIWDILKEHHLVGHNFLYDLFCFQADLGDSFELPKRWDDTFYASRLIRPEYGKFSLDNVMAQTLGNDPYADAGLNKDELQKSFEVTAKKPRVALTEDQLLYAAIDVYYLAEVWNDVKDAQNMFVYDLDIKTAEYQTIFYAKGCPIDLVKLKALRDSDNIKVMNLTRELPSGLNVNSYKQVRLVLGLENTSDELTLMMIAHRPNGVEGVTKNVKLNTEVHQFWEASDYTTDAITLAKMMKGVKFTNGEKEYWEKPLIEPNYEHKKKTGQIALTILAKRKALKRLNFNDRTLAAINLDNRIQFHGSPHAINGRVQQQDENLTQWPREMKSQFGFPEDSDRTLLYLDYAQVELRVICAKLPEMNMYKSLKKGVDLHTFVGDNLNIDMSALPEGITPRFVAKQCNFLLLYGGGAANFQQTVCKLAGVWFEDEVNKEILTNWKNIFSDIKEWHKVNARRANHGDLDGETSSGRKYVAKNYTDLNNIEVSGTASEIFKLAIHYIMKYKVLEGVGYVVNEVHDSILVDLPNDSAVYKRISYNVALCFQKAWFVITSQCALTDVPMPVDYYVGNNWEDLEYEKNLKHSGVLEEYYMMTRELEEEFRHANSI